MRHQQPSRSSCLGAGRWQNLWHIRRWSDVVGRKDRMTGSLPSKKKAEFKIHSFTLWGLWVSCNASIRIAIITCPYYHLLGCCESPATCCNPHHALNLRQVFIFSAQFYKDVVSKECMAMKTCEILFSNCFMSKMVPKADHEDFPMHS